MYGCILRDISTQILWGGMYKKKQEYTQTPPKKAKNNAKIEKSKYLGIVCKREYDLNRQMPVGRQRKWQKN